MASLIQSDKSVTGDLSKAKVVSRKKQFKDLDLNFIPHPIRKDIVPLKDDVAIKNAVKNLLVSNFYERPFSQDKGANLRGLLFEPADAITEISIKENIKRVIKKYEPRVAIRQLIINDLPDQNAYKILVNFKIKEFDTNQSVEIILRRLK